MPSSKVSVIVGGVYESHFIHIINLVYNEQQKCQFHKQFIRAAPVAKEEKEEKSRACPLLDPC